VNTAAALEHAAGELRRAGVDTPTVDAEWLLAHTLSVSRSELQAFRSRELSADEERSFRACLERRARREPLAYVLGEWGFRRLTLSLDPRALVPRPETETVVERCLALLADVPKPRVLDVGVGSGAIALAIADEHPFAHVVGIDSSEAALTLAGENRVRSGVDGRVTLVHGDLLEGVEGRFDLVVSNPPYVGAEELDALEPEVRDWEPRGALVDEGQTLRLARDAHSVLEGWLVLEVHEEHAQALSGELMKLGYRAVSIALDLSGRERVLEAQWGTSNA
jgi:release factor glutamine methyltransferase